MAAKQENNRGPGTRGERDIRPEIAWDDSHASTTRPDIWELTADREEISLLFGTAQQPPAGRGGIKIAPSARIILSPFVAKRLAIALDMTIQQYESRYGPLEEETRAPVPNGPLTPPPEKAFPHEMERGDDEARRLFRLVKGLNVQVGFERSFKVFRNTLLPDRFLMGFRRKELGREPRETIRNVCRQIGMPGDFLGTFLAYLSEANIILFGFEGNEKSCLYKAYLEFGHRITEAVAKNPHRPEPVLIHMGFKWDVSDNSQRSTTRYTAFPALSLQDMLERMTGLFYSHGRRNPFGIVEGIINLGASKVGPDKFLYFEADEENNPRTSFDINMYRAHLRMKELYPFLLDMARHYSIPDGRFDDLYGSIGSDIFGHLTGGVDREGREFLTVYFGEKGSSG